MPTDPRSGQSRHGHGHFCFFIRHAIRKTNFFVVPRTPKKDILKSSKSDRKARFIADGRMSVDFAAIGRKTWLELTSKVGLKLSKRKIFTCFRKMRPKRKSNPTLRNSETRLERKMSLLRKSTFYWMSNPCKSCVRIQLLCKNRKHRSN